MDKVSFYNESFQPILDDNDPIKDVYDTYSDVIESVAHINLNDVQNLVLKSALAYKMVPKFLDGVKRPQILYQDNVDYYIAYDPVLDTEYICYKNLLHFDIDFPITQSVFGSGTDPLDTNSKVNHMLLKDQFQKLANKNNQIYDVYHSTKSGGYHVFCISHEYKYRDKNTLTEMISNGADPYYTIFTFIRGFCVKRNNNYKFMTRITPALGTTNVLGRLEDLVQLHFK